MSSGAAVGASAGAIAAAAAREKARREEEEEMTKYNDQDLNGWEFKIMRSAWGKFSSREVIEQVCRDEAQAGWELVEKFDKNRLRFKRRIERRTNDAHLPFDAYRESPSFGGGSGLIVALVLGILLVGAEVIFLVTRM
jgi:hypothetical protein